MDDRDRRGRVPSGEGGGRRDNNDDVDFQPNHLRRKLLESLGMTLCIPAFNNEVLPLRVSEFPQTLEQRIVKFLISVRDKPDPPDFSRLLCACDERPSGQPAAEKGNEIAPSHGFAPSGRQTPFLRIVYLLRTLD